MTASKFYGLVEDADDTEDNPVKTQFRFRNRFAKQFEELTYEVCVGYGFCGSIRHRRTWHVDDFITKKGVLTAQKFAQLVLYADQLNCGPCSKEYRRFGPELERLFEKHFGRKVIHLSDLHQADPLIGKHPSKGPPICFSRRLPNMISGTRGSNNEETD